MTIKTKKINGIYCITATQGKNSFKYCGEDKSKTFKYAVHGLINKLFDIKIIKNFH